MCFSSIENLVYCSFGLVSLRLSVPSDIIVHNLTTPWFYWFTLANCTENTLWMLLSELSWSFCLTNGWWEAKAWNCQPNKGDLSLLASLLGWIQRREGEEADLVWFLFYKKGASAVKGFQIPGITLRWLKNLVNIATMPCLTIVYCNVLQFCIELSLWSLLSHCQIEVFGKREDNILFKPFFAQQLMLHWLQVTKLIFKNVVWDFILRFWASHECKMLE